MPGSGKSTIGIILARLTSHKFIDTDDLIQTSQGRTLQDIVDTEGHMALRKIEEEVLLDLCVQNHVIATGGSAAYSEAAMKHLKSTGIIFFLDVDLSTLKSRIHDYGTRGLAKHPDQTFDDLFAERYPLYTKYADIIVHGDGLSDEDICKKIIDAQKR
jgi:shikimate kinase